MAQKLELLIELDAKGAVQNVKSLNTEMDKLDKGAVTANKSSTGLAGSIGKMAVQYAAAAVAIGSTISFLKDSVTEAIDAERVQSKLNSTLRAHGESVQVVGGLIDDFASNMQAMTGVTDEEVKSLATLAMNLGLSTNQMQAATKGAIGLTNIFGGSMQSNMEAIAKALQGQWRQMDALIPEIKNTKDESEKLALMQKMMADGFTASTDAMKGMAGQLTTARNQWSDFKEGVGTALLGAFSGLSKISAELTGQASLVRRLRAEHEALAKAMDRSLAAYHAKGGQTFDEITLGDKASEEKILEIEKEYAKTKKEIAEIIRKSNVADQIKAEDEATRKLAETERKATEWTERFGSATGGLTDAGRDLYVQLLRVGGYMPEFTAETQKAAEEQEALTKRIKELITAEGELTPVGEGVYIGMLQWAGLLPEVTGAVEKNTSSWQELESQFQAIQRAIGYVDDMFSSLGLNVEGVTSQISNALGAAGMFSQGMESLSKKGGSLTDTLTGVTSIIGAVSAAIGIAVAIVKAFAGDGIGEAITRENQWMKLNKQLEEQLRDLAKATGSVHEATSIMLDEIINQTDITMDNFGEYAQRIREILSELDRGELTLAETQNEIGDSFEALISKAEELGTTGSNSLLTLFDDLASRGIEVAEITEYINEQMTAGLTGYKAYLEGDFSDATIGVFEDMLAYEKKVGENQTLIDGIEGITDALVGMSNASRLTEAEFDNFEKAGRDAYDALIAKGFTEKESLIELAPCSPASCSCRTSTGWPLTRKPKRSLTRPRLRASTWISTRAKRRFSPT